MTRAVQRSRLFTPLVYATALLLLLEEWCWRVGARLAARLGRWPLLAVLESRVRTLPPYAALCAFLLPGLLLLPVKLLALVAIAKGHAVSGIAAIVAAKIGGAAVVARLYALTLPTLLAVRWFAYCHGWFMVQKAHYIGRLRASHTYRRAGRALRAMKSRLRRGWRGRRGTQRPAPRFGHRHASHTSRVLRRLIFQWRSWRR